MSRFFAVLLLIPTLALAHGGEDHGDGAKPAAVASAAPRAEAQTEQFELLAIPAGGQLTIYLDRYASNEPVSGAKIEVESGSWKAVAQAAADGTYRVNAPQLAKPGQYPLLFTVQAGAESDLIEATLQVSEAPKAMEQAHPVNTMWWWVGGALAALAGISLLLKRRKTAQRISA